MANYKGGYQIIKLINMLEIESERASFENEEDIKQLKLFCDHCLEKGVIAKPVLLVFKNDSGIEVSSLLTSNVAKSNDEVFLTANTGHSIINIDLVYESGVFNPTYSYSDI